MTTVVSQFTARFDRRCDRCGVRIRQGHQVHCLDDQEHICGQCAKEANR
jgi:hypothetical protein